MEQLCAAGVVRDPAGRLLLVRRARPPAAGSWTIPGGRCEPGESTAEACAREMAEETGLRVSVGRLLGRVRRPGPGGLIYVIDDFDCEVVTAGSEPQARADDDADAVCWADRRLFDQLGLVPGLRAALASWDRTPR